MSRRFEVWLLLMAAVVLATACDDSSGAPAAAGDAAVAADGGDTAAPEDPFARAIATGPSHTCVLRQAGVFCWGANARGQLGTEDTADSAEPARASVDTSDVVEVAAQLGHTCIRRSSGELACWGGNESGQFGDGTRDDSLVPVVVSGVDDAKQLALADSSTCALRAGGSVWCWGGSPATTPTEGSLVPEPIVGLSGVVDIRAGAVGTYCARGEEGWVRCWWLEAGAWTAPVEAASLMGAQAIAVASVEEVCGILAEGEVVCHDLANGIRVPLPDSKGSIDLVGGLHVVCATGGADSWYCWNIVPPMLEAFGSTRQDLPSRLPLVELSTAGFRYCGLKEDGQVLCLESNSPSPQFTLVTGLPD
jgi:hypothetical protein